jgi:hypothetical protein
MVVALIGAAMHFKTAGQAYLPNPLLIVVHLANRCGEDNCEIFGPIH